LAGAVFRADRLLRAAAPRLALPAGQGRRAGPVHTLPQAYSKIMSTDNLSVKPGKLPTILGTETTFTYQNMNIQHGLLWNQENAVNCGVQVNYAQGRMTFALSAHDSFYSTQPN
jgi:hypothetical protein